MIGDDREKEFVETGQFGVIEIAAQPQPWLLRRVTSTDFRSRL